jgi:RNA-binding protein Musashi
MGDYYGAGAAAATPMVNLDADKIFVGGLSWQTTEESLRYHFEQYGPVLSVEVMKDRNTGDPRGFAFVVFTEIKTVDLVMEETRHEINHKVVDVKRAQARGIAPPSIHVDRRPEPTSNSNTTEVSPEQLQNKIFIGGLPPHVDKEELKRVFSQFGAVADAIIMMDQAQQRSRGFGFITFENGTGGAQKARAAQPVNVHGRMAEVKIATPKGEQTPRKPAALGLRAGISGSSSGEYAGLAASFGRNGWRAGYGTKAFGAAGWAVRGWDQGEAPERSGFSFDMVQQGPPKKRVRH